MLQMFSVTFKWFGGNRGLIFPDVSFNLSFLSHVYEKDISLIYVWSFNKSVFLKSDWEIKKLGCLDFSWDSIGSFCPHMGVTATCERAQSHCISKRKKKEDPINMYDLTVYANVLTLSKLTVLIFLWTWTKESWAQFCPLLVKIQIAP